MIKYGILTFFAAKLEKLAVYKFKKKKINRGNDTHLRPICQNTEISLPWHRKC